MYTRYTNSFTRVISTGFTLVELVVALAVVSILLLMAAPSSVNMIASNRLSTQTNEIITLFFLARSEAINRSAEVRVVPADPADWSLGISVVADTNKDGDFTDGVDTLRIASALEGNSLFTADGTNSLSNPYVAFNSRGALLATGDIFSFQLTDPACTGTQAHLITVATTGRASSTRISCP